MDYFYDKIFKLCSLCG